MRGANKGHRLQDSVFNFMPEIFNEALPARENQRVEADREGDCPHQPDKEGRVIVPLESAHGQAEEGPKNRAKSAMHRALSPIRSLSRLHR